jgi:hypothetical protein
MEMTNEYLEELRAYKRTKRLYRGWAYSETPLEGDIIAFLLHLKETWPHMMALEHRQDYRNWHLQAKQELNYLRHKSGRSTVGFGVDICNRGIFGQDIKTVETQLDDILPEEAHQGVPLLCKKKVIAMARAVRRMQGREK